MVFKKINTISEAGIEIQTDFPLYRQKNVVLDIFPSLKNHIDKDGLVPMDYLMSEFELKGDPILTDLGYFHSKSNEYTIMIHPFLRKSCSIFNRFNNSLLSCLLEFYNLHNHSLKFLLDLNTIMLTKDWHAIQERERYYGAPFNDDIPQNKPGCVHYTSNPLEKIINNSAATQFFWKSKKDHTFQLEIEEIKDFNQNRNHEYYNCKYIHSLYDKKLNSFCHFDCAIRQYDSNTIQKRIQDNIDKVDYFQKKTKVLRLDGIIPFERWKTIISLFMDHNEAVIDYFQ